MRILISNDDGYQAPGILCLAEAVASVADITVVAPDRDRSGASNSLTLELPIRSHTKSNGFICVDGTPTDCVHLAITGLLQEEPDIVISGINSGANLGDDVLYSGTVAAAMEGRFLGLPSIAISLAGAGQDSDHFDTAAKVCLVLLERLKNHSMPVDTILNVNVPNVPYDELQGFKATRLGHRHKAKPVVKSKDPRGRTIYWVGPPGTEQDAGEDTDFYAVRAGWVSITPLSVDLTRHETVSEIGSWLSGPTS